MLSSCQVYQSIRTAVWVIALCAVASGARAFAWGGRQHSQIVGAALTVVSEKDHLPRWLGEETWQLRYYVRMADWYDCFVSESEDWTIRDTSFGHLYAQFYANDYLIFPKAPVPFEHEVPGVLGTYRPFFFRALQALRTESPSNAARWVGSLLHFVTDSGSPPHALGINGEAHVKMETWVDASRIDLSGYEPQLLGHTDEEAARGLVRRMNGLIEFSKQRAYRLLPLVRVNDGAAAEPTELESATETAKVTAGVIHTLLVLTARPLKAQTASLVATVYAPPVTGMEFLPAKLMLAGTDYSTLSEPLVETPNYYRGSFNLHNLPPGSYRAIVERTGAQTLFTHSLVLRPGKTLSVNWRLKPSEHMQNLVRNPDFMIRWTARDAPDQWRFDRARDCWESDNIPVEAGRTYLAGYVVKPSRGATVKLQWMEAHWKPVGSPPIKLRPLAEANDGAELTAPAKAVYARFIVAGPNDPASSVQSVFLEPDF